MYFSRGYNKNCKIVTINFTFMNKEKQKRISNRVKTKRFIILVLILPLFLSGCISINNKKESVDETTGGLFRSSNLGGSWDQITTLYTIGEKTAKFDAANVTVTAFDPLDDSAIYLGTQHDGLFFSYNYGDGWFRTLEGKGTINDVIVDSKSNCTIYAAVHNTIYKSIDCSRSWKDVYFETLKGKYVTSLEVSKRDNKIVYAGTSGGNFLKSLDHGESWDSVKHFDNNIKDIVILDNSDSKVVYAITQTEGLYKSLDEGITLSLIHI